MELKDAKLFINPAAGRERGKKLASKITRYLTENGLEIDTDFSNHKGDLLELVKHACLDGYDTILIAGGDGSIFEAVNGIMQAEELQQGIIEHPTKVKLGIIPVGTGNDFIKAAKIPNDWQQACKLLLNSSEHLVDVAHVTTAKTQTYFVNNIGSGFDAACGITASKIPFIRGKLVYALALIWHLIKGVPNPEVEIKTENYENKTKTTLVAVSNGICYGGSFKITPQASINDGLIDAIIAPPVGRLGAIPLIIQLMRGTHLKNPKVAHLQCKEFHLKSDTPIPVIADGEVIEEDCLEYSVRILESKLCLLA